MMGEVRLDYESKSQLLFLVIAQQFFRIFSFIIQLQVQSLLVLFQFVSLLFELLQFEKRKNLVKNDINEIQCETYCTAYCTRGCATHNSWLLLLTKTALSCRVTLMAVWAAMLLARGLPKMAPMGGASVQCVCPDSTDLVWVMGEVLFLIDDTKQGAWQMCALNCHTSTVLWEEMMSTLGKKVDRNLSPQTRSPNVKNQLISFRVDKCLLIGCVRKTREWVGCVCRLVSVWE